MTWPTNHDHQVAIILLFLAAIGAIVWFVRGIRGTGQVIDNAPEFEAAHESRRTIPGPIVQRWSPEIEAQCKPWTDADEQAWAGYLSDMPYDQERDGL